MVKILIVEDEPQVMAAYIRILKSMDLEYVACYDGAEALAEFHKSPDKFSLVYTDLSMPHLDGMSLAKEILNMRPDIPIILASGFTSEDEVHRAKSIGIKKLLPKPFRLKEFKESILFFIHQTP